MPLTTGSLSCRCYRVENPPPRELMGSVDKELQRHAFRPVNPEQSPRSLGWVAAGDVLDNEPTRDKAQFGDYLVLGLRVDKVSVNTRLLKAHFLRRLRETLEKRQNKRLAREERQALLEDTKIKLMKETSPATSLYEMAWNLSDGRVYFTATGDTINQEFMDLFADSFHTALVPLFPFIRAEDLTLKDGRREALLQTTPALLCSRPAARHYQPAEEE